LFQKNKQSAVATTLRVVSSEFTYALPPLPPSMPLPVEAMPSVPE